MISILLTDLQPSSTQSILPEMNGKQNDLLNFCVASPLLLGLDRNLRKGWVDIISLYFATQAFDNVVYYGAIGSVRRPRPRAYNVMVPIGQRAGEGLSKSFFSGHTCFSATATFFAAKVYTDYHHLHKWNKIICYTVAAIPPAIIDYYRVKAGEHFKTDVMTGFLVGATSGILVPTFFCNTNRDTNAKLSWTPYYDNLSAGANLLVTLN